MQMIKNLWGVLIAWILCSLSQVAYAARWWDEPDPYDTSYDKTDLGFGISFCIVWFFVFGMTLKYFGDYNHPGWLSFGVTCVIGFVLVRFIDLWAFGLLAIGLAIYMYKYKGDDEDDDER